MRLPMSGPWWRKTRKPGCRRSGPRSSPAAPACRPRASATWTPDSSPWSTSRRARASSSATLGRCRRASSTPDVNEPEIMSLHTACENTFMEKTFNSMFFIIFFRLNCIWNSLFARAPRAGMRYGYPARQADALSWNSRAQGCFKGAGYPHRTPALSQRSSVPCASTAHTYQPIDFNRLLRGCRETVLLVVALCRMDRKRPFEPRCDFRRLAKGSILHHPGRPGTPPPAPCQGADAPPSLRCGPG